MATLPIIEPTTDAVSTEVDFDSSPYSYVLLAADGLATTETAGLFVRVVDAYVPVVDATGTAVTLTADVGYVQVPGGPVYGVTKDATVAECGVYAITGSLRH